MTTIKSLADDLLAKHLEYAEANDFEGLREVCGQLEMLLGEAPTDPILLFTIGTSKLQMGINGPAITYLKHASEMAPDLPEVWNNLGTAWKHENKNEQAAAAFLKATELREHPDFLNNIGTLYVNEGRPGDGEQFLRRAVELDPEHPKAQWNLSLILLEQGKWREGFGKQDFGLLSGDRPNKTYGLPVWNGEPGKRVIVYGEQGMGDEVMFSSCLPDMMKDVEVVFDCHPRMKDLFKRSFGIKCFGTRKQEAPGNWLNGVKADASIAIGSLMRLYRSEGDFPRKTYLTPDPKLVARYRKKLEALGPGPYVGIGWKGGAKRTRSDLRSVKLKWFTPILEQGGTFVSVQYTDDSAGKVERFKADSGFEIHHWPDVVENKEYDHSVALAAALDLVIVPNTTMVHVCGAIGQECWTLTPNAPAWRYGLESSEMPMYGPWVRQFREGDSWSDLFARVAAEYGAWKDREAAA
jgi:tetratricopeptide (TPR) repeat protein